MNGRLNEVYLQNLFMDGWTFRDKSNNSNQSMIDYSDAIVTIL